MIVHNGIALHTYTISGQPIAWARPRLSGRTFFDSQRPIKNVWAISLQYQREGQPLYEKTPLELIAHFYFQIPLSYNPKRREELHGQPYPFRGDLDNLLKFIGDTCNAILYDDDACIFRITASKHYDLQPRTEFAFIPHQPIQPTLKTEKKIRKKKVHAFMTNVWQDDE